MSDIIFENLDDADELSYLMAVSNRMYKESLDQGKYFSAEEWDKIQRESAIAQDHIRRAYLLLSDIANLTYKLRNTRNPRRGKEI